MDSTFIIPLDSVDEIVIPHTLGFLTQFRKKITQTEIVTEAEKLVEEYNRYILLSVLARCFVSTMKKDSPIQMHPHIIRQTLDLNEKNKRYPQIPADQTMTMIKFQKLTPGCYIVGLVVRSEKPHKESSITLVCRDEDINYHVFHQQFSFFSSQTYIVPMVLLYVVEPREQINNYFMHDFDVVVSDVHLISLPKSKNVRCSRKVK